MGDKKIQSRNGPTIQRLQNEISLNLQKYNISYDSEGGGGKVND